MALAVDGIEIGEDRIREEMQYHPAASPQAAREAAENALLVRTLLLAEARRLGITAVEPLREERSRLVEAPEEALIRTLVEREVRSREPSEEECRACYEASPASFRSPVLLQAAHILFAAKVGDEAAMAAARATLTEVLTDEAFAGMIAVATSFAAGIQDLIKGYGLPWSVSQLGARVEYRFTPDPPRTGGESAAHADAELADYLHVYLANRGVLLTPFHNMALTCPRTGPEEVARHHEAFAAALEELAG